MKRHILCMIASVLLAGCGSDETSTRDSVAARGTQQSWEDEFAVLGAYGNWIDVGVYGRVWQPAVSPGWRPYTYGQWVWTDRGWMWESDEPFGWVVYHYGYWTVMGAAGWVWVPSEEWSPAHVRWDNGDQYIAWAPAPPPQGSMPGAYSPGYDNYWVVVPAYQFTRTNVGSFRTTPTVLPSAPSGRRDLQRAPDVAKIARVTNVQIFQLQTEEENVRSGERTLVHVRVRPAEQVLPVSSPVAPLSPAPEPMSPVPGAARRVTPAPVTPAPAPATGRPKQEIERQTPPANAAAPKVHNKGPKNAVVKPKVVPVTPPPPPPPPAEKAKKDGK